MTVRDVDLALVGGGGAGLAVLHALAHRDLTVGMPRPLRVVVVDPVPDDDTVGRHRTWCFWEDGASTVAPVVHASWRHLRVQDADRDLILDLHPFRYHMVRSRDLSAHVTHQLGKSPRLHVDRLVAHCDDVQSRPDHGEVRIGPDTYRARLVLDSRPVRPQRAGSVWWWQHFRGWTLPPGSLPGDAAHQVGSLMDFRTSQPATGLSFGYVLPQPDGRVLAEYTEFSPERLDDAGYNRALRDYLGLLGVDPRVRPEHVETGAIPMTDGVFTRHVGPRVVRIGTAGGATRGSTGYTFSAMLRDGEAVADLVAGGALERPGPLRLPDPYPPRHRWMDAVMLQALHAGRLDGPSFFTGLFQRCPAERVLRFLDGRTTAREDLGIITGSPTWPMARTAIEGAARRASRRHTGPAVGSPVPVVTDGPTP